MWGQRTAPAEEQAPAWTGRLSFDLKDGFGWRWGEVELVVRRDLITVWLASKTLAVLDRQQFARWINSVGPSDFTRDDTTWVTSGSNVALRIGNGPLHPVSLDVVTKLRGLL